MSTMVAGSEFEIILLASFIKDNALFVKYSGDVGAEIFSSDVTANICFFLKQYYKDYERMPTRQELLLLMKQQGYYNDSYANIINSIYSVDPNVRFVSDQLESLLYQRRLSNILKSRYEDILMGRQVSATALLDDILKLESIRSSAYKGIDLSNTEYFQQQLEQRRAIPTPIDYLNIILGGGIHDGQLGIVLAPPNYGKTMLLLDFALYSWLAGNNVLFVTLEMQEYSIANRILFILSDIFDSRVTMENIKEVTSRVKSKFIILYKPTGTVGVDYLRGVYYKHAAEGLKFDQVYIDYADLLMSEGKYKEKRFEYASIFRALKALAQVIGISVWSATQSNRSGLKASRVAMEHMSESLEKAFISDIILSISEKMSANKSLSMFLTKNREGKSDIVIDVAVGNGMFVRDV